MSLTSEEFKKIILNKDNWNFDQDIELNKKIIEFLISQRLNKIFKNEKISKELIQNNTNMVIDFFNERILLNLFNIDRN